MKNISKTDNENLQKIRTNVSSFIAEHSGSYDSKEVLVLDVAPQDHEGAKPYFKYAKVETLDIDPDSGATYIADLCQNNEKIIPSNKFDVIICTEVLEHTKQPFDAVNELKRILKPGGTALVSTPYNLRIHGPLPDCWRFTEHGLRELFRDFETTDVKGLDDEHRFLMPVHYTTIARKRNVKKTTKS